MRTLRGLGATLLCGLLVSGCASAATPIWGFYTDVRGPYQGNYPTQVGQQQGTTTLPAGTPQEQQQAQPMLGRIELAALKRGEATAQSVMGIAAFGDCSIHEAARQAGISRIHHIDHHTRNFFGIYSEFTIIVYGE